VQLGITAPGKLILSGGGSHYFDIVADELGRDALAGTVVVIRSGSYVAHDHGTYLHDTPSERGVDIPPFIPAIEIHATVISRPQDELALINAGRRDVSFDSGLPVVLRVERAGEPEDSAGVTVVDLNDQHGFLALPSDSELAVGDVVVLGISHPCTTFDKWALASVVDDDDRLSGIAHTFF
jgi:D-serine deaminase-like pyridoxal phosphate-dependent protein